MSLNTTNARAITRNPVPTALRETPSSRASAVGVGVLVPSVASTPTEPDAE